MKNIMSKALLLTLLITSVSNAKAALDDSDILQPFTEEMAEAQGMTPVDEISTEKAGALKLSSETLERLKRENRVVITVDKRPHTAGESAQKLVMYKDGIEVFKTKISTGLETAVTATSGRTYVRTTPTGFFRPANIYTMYFSNTWKSDMPNAVFLVGGIAIHATPRDANHEGKLGQRASGGCVRTKLEDSKFIRETVMDTGMGSAEGQFKTVTESYRRFKVTDSNRVTVPSINRNNGVQGAPIKSWDTVIVIHE
ncbi:MAG: L,D-transpeptidase [Bacteriovoracaceae bacterium]|nr:L,D-transpeptidase [Bacteriovoracaceae bacterium]